MYLLTGLLVWVFARESYHIGASGVLYAEVAFVAWMAYIVGEVIPIEKSKEQEARERLLASEDPERYLFPRDTFDMTKEERAIEEQRRREEAHRRWLEANQIPPPPQDIWRSDHT